MSEILSQQRRLHTPDSTTELRQGDAIDSGIAMILDSNLTWLSRESLHHLGSAIVGGAPFQGDPTTGFIDVAPVGGSTDPLRLSTWSYRDSVCWGPFDLTPDRVTAEGTYLRAISVAFDCVAATAASLRVVAALTASSGAPTNETVLAWSSAYALTTRSRVVLTLRPTRVQTTLRRARPDAREHAAVTDCWLWAGWHSQNSGDRVIAIDSWEHR